MKKHVKVITFHPKILAMSDEDYQAWLERSDLKGLERPKKKTTKKGKGRVD